MQTLVLYSCNCSSSVTAHGTCQLVCNINSIEPQCSATCGLLASLHGAILLGA
jgi:hypothetical protein